MLSATDSQEDQVLLALEGKLSSHGLTVFHNVGDEKTLVPNSSVETSPNN